jgi:phenylalanine-4-hydroxylase
MTDQMIFDQQPHDQYTAEEQEIWSMLVIRQMKVIKGTAYSQFAWNMKNLGLNAAIIPDIKRMNPLLEELTGWNIYPLPGLLTEDIFFRLMLFKRFGIRTEIRKMDELDSDEVPDIFTNVFGHAPLLADPVIAAFLFDLAGIAERYSHHENSIEIICQIYWYTMEYGLVKEKGKIKVFGGSLLSSAAEGEYALSSKAYRQPFHFDLVMNTPFRKIKFLEQYFVLDSLGQLGEILAKLDYALSGRDNKFRN